MEPTTIETTPPAMDEQKLQQIARGLRKRPPRSPRQKLGGFVIAARMVDKARADLLGVRGNITFIPADSALISGNSPG